jgi:hypothetical protein
MEKHPDKEHGKESGCHACDICVGEKCFHDFSCILPPFQMAEERMMAFRLMNGAVPDLHAAW